MANPLFNEFKPQNGMSNFIAQVKQMKQSFQGNPKDEVQRLLNSGQMSQQQFNELAQMANQIRGMM